MPPEPKPQTAAGYRREETAQVEAACLTIATELGDLMDELCIVGGLAPSMLIDRSAAAAIDEARHCGTNDLDVGLSAALMDDRRYAEISQRLREGGFRNDDTKEGRPTRQRWRLGALKVTVDFLIAPLSEGKDGGDIQDLEADFAAIVAPGLELAFDEQIPIWLAGRDLKGDLASREVRVAGPGAFTILKALAFRRRGLGKDATWSTCCDAGQVAWPTSPTGWQVTPGLSLAPCARHLASSPRTSRRSITSGLAGQPASRQERTTTRWLPTPMAP